MNPALGFQIHEARSLEEGLRDGGRLRLCEISNRKGEHVFPDVETHIEHQLRKPLLFLVVEAQSKCISKFSRRRFADRWYCGPHSPVSPCRMVNPQCNMFLQGVRQTDNWLVENMVVLLREDDDAGLLKLAVRQVVLSRDR